MGTHSARECVMTAPAQLLCNWRDMPVINKSDFDSRSTGEVGRVYYMEADMLINIFIHRGTRAVVKKFKWYTRYNTQTGGWRDRTCLDVRFMHFIKERLTRFHADVKTSFACVNENENTFHIEKWRTNLTVFRVPITVSTWSMASKVDCCG